MRPAAGAGGWRRSTAPSAGSLLPPQTRLLCGHEYTETNARFALTIEPDNAALRAEAEAAGALRAAGRPTVPTTLAQELAANPYFRARDLAEFTARREAKNHFR